MLRRAILGGRNEHTSGPSASSCNEISCFLEAASELVTSIDTDLGALVISFIHGNSGLAG